MGEDTYFRTPREPMRTARLTQWSLLLALVVTSACFSATRRTSAGDAGTQEGRRIHANDQPTVETAAPWTGSPGMREARLAGDESQLLVEAKLNGRVSGVFLLDTGASYCVITPETARQLDLAHEETAEPVALVTPAGRIEAPLLRLRSIEVGYAQAGDVSTIIYPAVDAPLSGILGLSFLSQFEFSVDARRRLLRLTPF